MNRNPKASQLGRMRHGARQPAQGRPMRSRSVQNRPVRLAAACIVVAAWAMLVPCGCSKKPAIVADAAGRPLQRLTLGLNWYPEAEHGGYYAAQVHGYFAEEGLDVVIVSGGPESPVVQQVASGERDFGVANADNILFARAQQARVVAIMAPLQRSPRCIMVHAAAGIRDFADLAHMRLGMSTTQAFSHFLRKKAPLDNVQIVPAPPNVAQFLEDPRFGQQAYVFSEPYIARKRGADPQVLMLADLGFNPYTSLLLAAETTTRGKPELCRKLVRAAVRGWEKYLAEPADTNARLQQLNPEMDADILAYGAAQMAPLVHPSGGDVPVGTMTPARWRELGQQLVEADQLRAEQVDSDGAFTLQFLPAQKPAASPAGAPSGRE